MYVTDSINTENKSLNFFNKILGFIIDIFRSIPFVVLILLLIPFTLWLMGTIMGPTAALPALVISVSPFFARISYLAFKEIPKGNTEALKSMGISPLKVFLLNTKEALPALVSGYTITLVTLVGFIAAAGIIGTGGLGKLAIDQYFINPLNPPTLMYLSVVLLLILVIIIQLIGDITTKIIDKR